MRVAFIVPCLDEELTIGTVVADCRAALPAATVYVFDNGSTDRTAAVASAAGAVVVDSPARGKGNVLRQAFRDLDADWFVMIDGDGTYPAHESGRLIQMAVRENCDMICGARLKLGRPEAFRPLHYVGNHLFTGAVHLLFGRPVQDLLTGFRVFSRHFARTVDVRSRGFEVETELTIRALIEGLPFVETPIPYVERPEGSRSKLRTFRDGFWIGLTILALWIGSRGAVRAVTPADARDRGERAA